MMQSDPRNPSSSTPPSWLRWFVNDVSRAVVDRNVQPPLGCHFFFDVPNETWEVTLFVSRTEVIGGPLDGSELPNGLQFDIAAVTAGFDRPPAIHWQVGQLAEDDELGSHLSFEGMARGHRVWLRLKQEAPAWAGPGRLLHAADGTLEELW